MKTFSEYITNNIIKKSNNEKVIEQVTQNNLPIIIYGAGNTGEAIGKYLNKYELQVYKYCVDEEYYLQNAQCNGVDIVTFREINQSINKYNIILAFDNVKKLKKAMKSKELLDKGIISIIDNPDSFYKMDYQFIIKNEQYFQKFYELLGDELSRKVLLAILDAKTNCLSTDVEPLQSFFDGRQYFNELLYLCKFPHNVIVDCGAFNGDTIMGFAEFVDYNCEKYYAFEPDKKNCQVLAENVKNIENVIIINKGVWNSNSTLYFKENGCSDSCISSEGTVALEVTTIDEVVGDTDVTFIKMDVEGSELMALEGAQKTITRCMPMLAICVYHKIDDLISIPTYIQQFESKIKKYKLFIRQHSCFSREFVLYAVPIDK